MNKFLKTFLLVSVLITGSLEAGKIGIFKKITGQFLKGSSKKVIKSTGTLVRQEFIRFDSEREKLFINLKKKKTTKNKDKKRGENTRKMLSIASWNLQNHSINGTEHKRDSINKYIKSLFYIQNTDIVFLQELRDNKGDSLCQTHCIEHSPASSPSAWFFSPLPTCRLTRWI